MAPNGLAKEKSPYLQQHANNPVEWLPWGDEAFEKAKREDKPVFLSCGYSTCHWCHVMEHESFRDEEVAALLNAAFVPVKVDREERPDIDATYMAACQVLNKGGGWPLNVFLTPEGKPFFAATYLPKRGSQAQPGLVDMIPRVRWLWATKRDAIEQSADSIIEALRKGAVPTGGSCPGKTEMTRAYGALKKAFDPAWGGFYGAPKFPAPHRLSFLLRYGQEFREQDALNMVAITMRRMWDGGVHDHLGGGFFRYSVDERWGVPHFEKMLYDQALLLHAGADAFEVFNDPFFEAFCRDIVSFLYREMRSHEGAFAAALDADAEGMEGGYYLWSDSAIREVLSEEDAALFKTAYSVLHEGNLGKHGSMDTLGKNVLRRSKTSEELAALMRLSPAGIEERLSACVKALLAKRDTKRRPFRDEKILTDWNGLAIAALARAGRLCGRKEYIDGAVHAANFIHKTLWDGKGELRHRYIGGETAVSGMLPDYAFLARGFLELYEATKDARWRKDGLAFVTNAVRRFWDEKNGGFEMSVRTDARLFLPIRDAHDGDIPSGNAAMVQTLMKAYESTKDGEYLRLARRTASAFADAIHDSPGAHTHLLEAVLPMSRL